MSDFFHPGRWRILLARQWSDNRRRYVFSILTVLLLLLAVFTLYLLSAGHYGRFEQEFQAAIFFTGLFLTGCLFAATLFSDLGSKSRGIAYLTLPASRFEKLLTAILYGAVLYPLIYLVLFYILDTATVKISNTVRYEYWLERKAEFEEEQRKGLKPASETYDEFLPATVVNVFRYERYDYKTDTYQAPRNERNVYRLMWCYFLAAQAFYAMGSIFFGRFSFIKTTVFIFGLCLLFFLLFSIIYLCVPGWYQITQVSDAKPDGTYFYRIPGWIVATEVFVIEYVFTPLFWFIAYLRLKEKEI